MSEWISVDDRLPDSGGVTVFVYAPDCFAGSDEIHKTFYINGAFSGFPCGATKVTHWMPLPEPPQDN